MMYELLAHLFGDYNLQSDWMAQEKTKNWGVAIVHAVVYSLPFLFFAPILVGALPSPAAMAVIISTHAVIDRYRLARFPVFAKNFLAPRSAWPTWEDCKDTGYPKSKPPFMAIWLLIISDNSLHILINHIALRYL